MDETKKPITLSYKIQYEPGGRYYSRNTYPCAYVTDEEYRKIIIGVLKDIPLDQIEGIEHVLEETRQSVRDLDIYTNKDGSYRDKPLQKPRTISDIRLSLPEEESKKYAGSRIPWRH